MYIRSLRVAPSACVAALGLFMHCEKKNFPVTIHFGKPDEGQGLIDDMGLVRLEKVLRQFPRLTILGHAAISKSYL